MDKKTISIVSILVVVVAVIAFILIVNNNQTSQNNMPQEENNNQTQDNSKNQGVKIETLKEGSGQEAKTGDTVTVDYVGTLEDGTKFDSSIDRGKTFELTLGEGSVIEGWEVGVLGMKVGEKRRLTIPAEFGYGPRDITDGVGNVIIPANSTLIFEVDLLGIN